MDKIKEQHKKVKELNMRIKRLHQLLENTKKRKSDEIDNCSHEVVFIYNKEYEYNEKTHAKLVEAMCLVCGRSFYFEEDKKVRNRRFIADTPNKYVNPNEIIDITDIVSKDLREREKYDGLGMNLCAERAKNKFDELMEIEGISLEEIKKEIIDDAICFEKETLNEPVTRVADYTIEEVQLAIKPDSDLTLKLENIFKDNKGLK